MVPAKEGRPYHERTWVTRGRSKIRQE